MSSGQREHDINAELDKQAAIYLEQEALIERIADEIAQIQPGTPEYRNLMFMYNYQRQILSVESFIRSIKHIQ